MKLKSKGSGPLVIKNAHLPDRKGVSFEVNPGELLILRSEAFNPLLTVEQLMKQALSRVYRERSLPRNRHREDTGPIWQVSCDEISYAAGTEAFRLSNLDLNEVVDDLVNEDITAHNSSGSKALDELVDKLLCSTEAGGLVVAYARTMQTSMSFRLDPESASSKVGEVIGELTREGAGEAELVFKVFSPEIRSRKELDMAQTVVEYTLCDPSGDATFKVPAVVFRSLNLAQRYYCGALRWARNSEARLLLIDTPRFLMTEKQSKDFLDDLRKVIKPTQMCVVFEDTSVVPPPPQRFQLNPDQLVEFDKRLADFCRRRDRLRLLDWTGSETALAELFAVLPDARRNGLIAKDFIRQSTRHSCPICTGGGVETVSMGPFGDLQTPCRNCMMTGFSENVLQVKLGERTFGDVLCSGAGALTEIMRDDERLKVLDLSELRSYQLCDPLSIIAEAAIFPLLLQVFSRIKTTH